MAPDGQLISICLSSVEYQSRDSVNPMNHSLALILFWSSVSVNTQPDDAHLWDYIISSRPRLMDVFYGCFVNPVY